MSDRPLLAGLIKRRAAIGFVVGFELNGAVFDAKPLPEQVANRLERHFGRMAGRQSHMGRKRLQTAGDRPDMQIMHTANARQFEHRLAHMFDFDMRRRAFHENIDRVAQERP